MRITEKAIANLDQVKDKIPQWCKEAIIEHKEDILNILKWSQLGKGLNSYGKPLKWSGGDGKYSDATQDIANDDLEYTKNYSKTAGQPYNFNWSEKTFMFMDLKVEASKQVYDIFTTGGKQDLLESIYGEIFKLTDQHNEYVNETILAPYLEAKMIENMFNF